MDSWTSEWAARIAPGLAHPNQTYFFVIIFFGTEGVECLPWRLHDELTAATWLADMPGVFAPQVSASL